MDVPTAAFDELRAVYREMETALAPYRRVCESSGRCCRFASADHMLFVTGLEAAWMAQADQPRDPAMLAEGSCPYLREGLCSIREHRALGCRIYYCDRDGEEQRNEVYETFLRRIRAIETKFDLPSTYMPVTKAFAEASPA